MCVRLVVCLDKWAIVLISPKESGQVLLNIVVQALQPHVA